MKNPNQVDNNQETIQLAEFYKSFIREKAHSKEYADLMNPIIQKIDEEHVKYINNSISNKSGINLMVPDFGSHKKRRGIPRAGMPRRFHV